MYVTKIDAMGTRMAFFWGQNVSKAICLPGSARDPCPAVGAYSVRAPSDPLAALERWKEGAGPDRNGRGVDDKEDKGDNKRKGKGEEREGCERERSRERGERRWVDWEGGGKEVVPYNYNLLPENRSPTRTHLGYRIGTAIQCHQCVEQLCQNLDDKLFWPSAS